MSRALRVMVVDDEPLARDELKFLLGEVGDVEVVGEAASSTEALTKFGVLAESEEGRPDAVFVDLRMPGPDGLALSEALLSRAPGLAIVVVVLLAAT